MPDACRLGYRCVFFSFFVVFLILTVFTVFTGYNLCSTRLGGCWKATTMTKSPNDASHVIWAIGVFFFLISLCFFKLTIVLLYIQVIIYVVHDWEGAGRQQR